jgi:hypothetical protein
MFARKGCQRRGLGHPLVHDRGRALVGAACRTADGGEVISDFRMIGDPAAENTTRNVS